MPRPWRSAQRPWLASPSSPASRGPCRHGPGPRSDSVPRDRGLRRHVRRVAVAPEGDAGDVPLVHRIGNPDRCRPARGEPRQRDVRYHRPRRRGDRPPRNLRLDVPAGGGPPPRRHGTKDPRPGSPRPPPPQEVSPLTSPPASAPRGPPSPPTPPNPRPSPPAPPPPR